MKKKKMDFTEPSLLYDDSCGMCSSLIEYLESSSEERIQTVPLSSKKGKRLKKKSGIEEDSVILLADDSYLKSEAVLETMNYFGSGHRFIAQVLSWLPSRFRDRCYDALAKRRHFLSGKE